MYHRHYWEQIEPNTYHLHIHQRKLDCQNMHPKMLGLHCELTNLTQYVVTKLCSSNGACGSTRYARKVKHYSYLPNLESVMHVSTQHFFLFRHPQRELRPDFSSLLYSLNQTSLNTECTCKRSPGDQGVALGAPVEAGEGMFAELNQLYLGQS